MTTLPISFTLGFSASSCYNKKIHPTQKSMSLPERIERAVQSSIDPMEEMPFLAECPVEAIFHEDNVPEEWQAFTELNAEMSPKCPKITDRKEPLVGCGEQKA